MIQCDRKKACKFQGLCGECLINKWDCLNREIQPNELRDKPDLTRIADALEKIGKELEKTNRLKALSFRKDTYVELDEIDEIMEG